MILVLDFDRTLFDTDAFYERIRVRGIEHLLGTLASLRSVAVASLIYPEVVPFLHAHAFEAVHIVTSVKGVYGRWDARVQREKIRRSGVSTLVDSVVVVENDKVPAITALVGDTPAVFIDDLPQHLAAVRVALPNVTCVHIDRLGTAPPTDFPRISNLNELGAIVNES